MNLLVLTLFLGSFITSAKVPIILIDPGHGGSDLGAKAFVKKGKKLSPIYEKDLSLMMALKLKAELQKKYRVFLTRTVDRAVGLNERAEMAESVQADIMLSIHVNSSSKSGASGVESYYLDTRKDRVRQKVENVENGPFEKESPLVQKILTDLISETTPPLSKKLASSIHSEVIKSIKGHKVINRGPRPGLFYVLALSGRPSALLETGFMSNEKERVKLMNSKYQEDYVKGVSKGVDLFFKKP